MAICTRCDGGGRDIASEGQYPCKLCGGTGGMNMQAKHTPGPWVFEDEYVRAKCLNGDYGNAICDPYCLPTKEYGEEMEANARLIAAAPEMLERAEQLLARLDNITTEEFSRGGEKQEREALRAAIAKATGE